MRIIVCVKQVADPEAPAGSFTPDPEGRRVVVRRGVSQVLSTYDENAIEAALRIKDASGARVTLLAVGPPQWQDFLQEAMGTGADEAFLLSDPSFQGLDSFAIAYVLAQGVRKLGEYDLVLFGRQAADTDAGITGPALAEHLSVPCITIARTIEVSGNTARVERLLEEGYDVLQASLPAVMTVTSEALKLRYATMDTIMAATEREVPVWNAQDIGASPEEVALAGSRVRLVRLEAPPAGGQCQIVEGKDGAEKAASLAALLRRQKLL
ncbi:MAG TPA: electron transfer flavoprotein subunit beta/FixA family protein [Dehalococcoidia bacterium]|nr:electron transfer flavoprotein subunit beta/FixA family protein [Dehalococcoidia bacterium]